RPVDIHLAAGHVYGLADRAYVLLVDAGRRRVGEHDRRHLPLVRLQLDVQVGEVDRAVRVTLDHRDPQPGQHRAGRIGAVRRFRDQADVAAVITARGVVAPDREQAGQLTLGA